MATRTILDHDPVMTMLFRRGLYPPRNRAWGPAAPKRGYIPKKWIMPGPERPYDTGMPLQNSNVPRVTTRFLVYMDGGRILHPNDAGLVAGFIIKMAS